MSIKSSRQATTWHLYRRIIEKFILPDLGNIRLRDLKPEHLQSLYDRKLEAGLGVRSVQQTHSVLHVALKGAVNLGMIARNPAAAVTRPKQAQKEMSIYDENQVKTLLVSARERGDRNFALYQLAITSGMRMGELLGLKWVDLEWERRELQVRRQVRRKVGGGHEYVTPKTKAGKRTILLGKSTLEVLRMHLEEQYRVKLVAGDRWQDRGLVFPSKIGTPMDAGTLRKEFKVASRKARLPGIRFHDLRHTAASLMLNYSIPVIIVSRRLGHSKPSITLDVYGHLIPSKQEEAAELMDDIVKSF